MVSGELILVAIFIVVILGGVWQCHFAPITEESKRAAHKARLLDEYIWDYGTSLIGYRGPKSHIWPQPTFQQFYEQRLREERLWMSKDDPPAGEGA